MKIKEKSILITGASSGIGAELAKIYAEQNAAVFLVARRINKLNELKSKLDQFSSKIFTYQCDVSNKSEVADTFKQIKKETSFIDIAILNAGSGHNMKIENFNSELAEEIFGANVLGMIYWIEQLLPDYLKNKKGILAGVSSLADNRGYSGSGFYCASKAAATIYLDGLRVELKKHGVKVITIKPGFVKTPMTDKNNFKMPLLMSVEKAGRIIFKGIKKEKNIIQFPMLTVIGSKLIGALPTSIYEKLPIESN
ncbi:MAG: SDR family NAD(P)-dependent oxidoreductase [Ignavibacteriae bacterium]|nr:SDR family NAD(P)-dependent oxidoreductase [Ignavibacteriota bacterium]NOG99824.1 SDR family NAD(P)-dependent oxidoreductase [Ignavibacteriota bacterium]